MEDCSFKNALPFCRTEASHKTRRKLPNYLALSRKKEERSQLISYNFSTIFMIRSLAKTTKVFLDSREILPFKSSKKSRRQEVSPMRICFIGAKERIR